MSGGNPYLAHLDHQLPIRSRDRRPKNPVFIRKEEINTDRSDKGEKPSYRSSDGLPVYRYGNYDHYYGYRIQHGLDDRLKLLDRSFFENKRVLDVGCNSGWLTVAIAMLCHPRMVEGVDIDPKLIRKAQSHLAFRASACRLSNSNDASSDFDFFPTSCSQMFGPLPIIIPDQPESESMGVNRPFPLNVTFRCSDWVNEPSLSTFIDDSLKYDTILALSITKWIHLSWGDGGIRHFFIKCYAQLKPDGKLVLESQPFETYGKKPTQMTRQMKKNLAKIWFKPEHFDEYLLGKDVGFKSVVVLGSPLSRSTAVDSPDGFKSRILKVFQK